MVVGRAGIGLDNVDLDAATARGVMVVNAPESNVVSAAEHTMALLLAQARNVPQAHAALVDGRWERSKWEGVELADKTLGIVGLGRIGKLVADRARGFGMRLVAFDPYVSAERARLGGVELMSLEQVVAESDFLTIHLPKTTETAGLIGRELLLKAKPGLRIVNVARGGIVDEAALAEALRDGHRRPAPPSTSSPPNRRPSRRCSASTRSSSRRTSGRAPGRPRTRPATRSPTWSSSPSPASSSRSPSTWPSPRRTIRCARSCPLAERLGGLFGSLVGAGLGGAQETRLPPTIEVCVEGEIGAHDTRIVGLAVLKGLFSRVSSEPVTYVNAPQRAKDHGLELREVSSTISEDYVNLVSVSGGGHSISGTLHWRRSEQRIVLVDGHTFDVPPVDHMVMITNDDRPGRHRHGRHVARRRRRSTSPTWTSAAPTRRGQAVMLIAPTSVVEPAVLDALRAAPGIVNVVALSS